MGATTTTSSSRASSAILFVIGPGMGSAVSKYRLLRSVMKKSSWKTSGRSKICACLPAASRIISSAREVLLAGVRAIHLQQRQSNRHSDARVKIYAPPRASNIQCKRQSIQMGATV